MKLQVLHTVQKGRTGIPKARCYTKMVHFIKTEVISGRRSQDGNMIECIDIMNEIEGKRNEIECKNKRN